MSFLASISRGGGFADALMDAEVDYELDNNYKVVISRSTLDAAQTYLSRLQLREDSPGTYLAEKLKEPGIMLENLSTERFLELLVQTKQPCVFVESVVEGDGSDWNHTELSILGAVNVVVPVMIFDNGASVSAARSSVDVDDDVTATIPIRTHMPPFRGVVLFSPAALLRSGGSTLPADWESCVVGGGGGGASSESSPTPELNFDGYFDLYERRLLPLLRYADAVGERKGQDILITIPPLGCGAFAGPFEDQKMLGEKLGLVLKRLVESHASSFSRIRVLYYDPGEECSCENDFESDGVRLMIRAGKKLQLCAPQTYADPDSGDNFRNCFLMSVAEWDHVSWPGNDVYNGSRSTDGSIKAAATDALRILTGVDGLYEEEEHMYLPPGVADQTWGDIVRSKDVKLWVVGKLEVYDQ